MYSKSLIPSGLILISLLIVQLPFSTVQEQATWYVAVTGSDLSGDGSLLAPFATIQRAIDLAQDGDTVIVKQGRYTGQGNRDLDFQGKAITVKSQNPEDANVVRSTVLDAQGTGVIARFIHDEGPGTIFAGFTLVSGDTLKPVRGLPGFFEFSPLARPQTKHLRVAGEGPAPQISADSLPASEAVQTGRVWDGLDPYHQPFATSDYYGSGDVDNDGNLTNQDASLAQEMVSGTRAAVHRADVDGNGIVDIQDVQLIEAALTEGYLPGWWNRLANRAERNAWIDRVLVMDPTDGHIYDPTWFVCWHFALQMHIYGAGYRDELFYSPFDGGYTRYNLPVYTVSVDMPQVGHVINAILVGDNPLNFEDWRFIEPQTDQDVQPGMWDMPYGSTIMVESLNRMGAAYSYFAIHLVFSIDESGGSLMSVNPDLQTERTPAPEDLPDNRVDLWNPTIVPSGDGLLLFETLREGLLPSNDVFVEGLEVPFSGAFNAKPLNLSDQVSRWLDVARGPDGTIHLLWKSKPGYTPGVFYAKLNPATQEVYDVMRVSTETSAGIRAARLLITPEGEVHAFWFHQYPSRVYWSRLLSTGWQEKQSLTPGFDFYDDASGGINRDFGRFQFDAAVLANGDLMVAWLEADVVAEETRVYYRRFEGDWGNTMFLEQTNARGLALATSGDGKTHLVYWLGPVQHDWEGNEGRGILALRAFNGQSWAARQTLDDSGQACCANFSAGYQGELVLAWESKAADRGIPYWSRYTGGEWSVPQSVSTTPGSDAWYPVAEFLPGGEIALAWSSRTTDLVTIETTQVTGAMQVSIDVWPGKKQHRINLNSKATVPIAILSTSGFDAPAQINWGSLTFGSSGDEPSLHWLKRTGSPACKVKDTNLDGQTDLMCDFEIPKLGFQCGDTTGILQGITTTGIPIEGWDEVLIHPCP